MPRDSDSLSPQPILLGMLMSEPRHGYELYQVVFYFLGEDRGYTLTFTYWEFWENAWVDWSTQVEVPDAGQVDPPTVASFSNSGCLTADAQGDGDQRARVGAAHVAEAHGAGAELDVVQQAHAGAPDRASGARCDLESCRCPQGRR